ncbi:apolipoprotein D-like [Periplaneta americana]|uniref:apolipoprotein D-like n=1 Tax=Periplaneta americana TaxID=6978 RepID=UPI0037E78512
MSTFKLFVVVHLMTTLSIVSATLVPKLSGYSYHIGNCPVVESQRNFFMDRFLGMWYVLYKTSTGIDCLMMKIERTNDTEKFKATEVSQHILLGLTNINHKYTYEGELTIPDKNDRGRMEIRLPAKIIKRASFVVFLTDYDKYAGVFSCQKLAFANRQTTFILSRSPTLDQMDIDKMRQLLTSYGINDVSLSKIKHDCTPYDENTWEIKVNPTTLTLKGIANTIGHHVDYGLKQAGRALGEGIYSVGNWASRLLGYKPRQEHRDKFISESLSSLP